MIHDGDLLIYSIHSEWESCAGWSHWAAWSCPIVPPSAQPCPSPQNTCVPLPSSSSVWSLQNRKCGVCWGHFQHALCFLLCLENPHKGRSNVGCYFQILGVWIGTHIARPIVDWRENSHFRTETRNPPHKGRRGLSLGGLRGGREYE